MDPYFVSGEQKYEVELQSLEASTAPMRSFAPPARGAAAPKPIALSDALKESGSKRLREAAKEPAGLAVVHLIGHGAKKAGRATTLVVTDTLIVEGAHRNDLKFAEGQGARVVEEGHDGKALLRVDGPKQVFQVIDKLLTRNFGAVVPNFLRRAPRVAQRAPQRAWAHGKIHLSQAWKITKGSPLVRVAVLDEGVDTSHPSLRKAIYKERDFIGDNGNSAMPDGDDAHGTACAGIILSRDHTYSGIAPRCMLIAARIAMGDGNDGWIFEDWATAEAIDWAWREGAHVLSNSWGGGAPSDAISRAFGRARTQGRGGLGSLVVIAAGNDQSPIDFPGNLPGYVTVGASNPQDERKTRSSSDGENWWGSNYGPTLSLLAPGVFIRTTDIAGPRGYETGDFTNTFNGTSSATPHVAGAAALMFSANPDLSASDARQILQSTAVPLAGQHGRNDLNGSGRLDVARAVAASRPGSTGATPRSSQARRRTTQRPPKRRAAA